MCPLCYFNYDFDYEFKSLFDSSYLTINLLFFFCLRAGITLLLGESSSSSFGASIIEMCLFYRQVSVLSRAWIANLEVSSDDSVLSLS